MNDEGSSAAQGAICGKQNLLFPILFFQMELFARWQGRDLTNPCHSSADFPL